MTLHTPKVPCDQDVVDQALALFGTVANAQRLLRVQHVPYQHANAALRGNPVTEEINDAITIAWRTWKQLFVRGLRLPRFRPDLSFRLPETTEQAYGIMNDISEQEVAEFKRLKGRYAKMGT